MFLAFQGYVTQSGTTPAHIAAFFHDKLVQVPVFKRLRRQIDRSQSFESCNSSTCRKPGCLHLKRNAA